MNKEIKLLQKGDVADVYGYNGYLFIVSGGFLYWRMWQHHETREMAPFPPFALRKLLKKIIDKIDADCAYWDVYEPREPAA